MHPSETLNKTLEDQLPAAAACLSKLGRRMFFPMGIPAQAGEARSAKVNATIHVGQIVINGDVTGDVYAKQSVELNKPARLRGNIHTPQLMIEKGVIFEGSCKMENLDKLSKKPSPATVSVLPGQAPEPTN